MVNFDLLSIGDATVDVFITPSESESLCNLDDKECFICFSYGDKIPVKNLQFSIGGNAANNAVGSSRLGIRAALVLTLGDDKIASQILETLNGEKVDTSYVSQQKATNSNYSVIVNYSGERTIFSYHAPKSYEFPVQLPLTPWVYLTSMGESFRPFYNHLVEWLKRNSNIRLAFNPGSRQLRAGREMIADVISLSDVLFVNRKEAEKLSQSKDSQNKEKELLLALAKLGVKMPIITDGANGSFAYDGQRFFKAGVLPVDAYERTGAGDAFGTGCLSALIKAKSLQEAMVWGSLNSASVIGYVGSQKGLLTLEQMPQWLERFKSSGGKVEEF